jgi:hypothetical protein
LNDSEIKAELQPYPSKIKGKDKPAPIDRMIKAVDKMTEEDARKLLAAAQARLGIRVAGAAVPLKLVEDDDNPIEREIQKAQRPALREAGSTLREAPLAALLVNKPAGKAKRR